MLEMMKIQKTQENGVGSTIEEENDGDDEEDEIESNEKLIMRRRSSGRNRSRDHQKKEEAGVPQERAQPPEVENSEFMQSMGDWNYNYFFQTVDNYPGPSLEVKEEKVMENDESKVFDEIPKRKENVEEKRKEVPPPPVVEDVAEEERVVAAAASGGGSVGRNVKRGKSTEGIGEKKAGKGSMNLLHVFVELDDHFLKASVSAHDVSKMLEATRLHYHSNFVDNRDGFAWLLTLSSLMFSEKLEKKISPHIDHLVGWNLMARPGNKIIQAKLVLLGDMGTGKTSLALRFIKGQFYDQQEPTIGAAFFTQILSLSEATVKFDIWDTAGQERYHSLAPMYYRGAAAAVVVYDISNMDTFNRANKLVQELQRQGNQIVVMALAANKSDLDSQREVPTEEGEQFSQENGMFYIETSAKTAQNTNELFYEIAKRLARVSPPKRSGINLNPETPERKGFCCLG